MYKVLRKGNFLEFKKFSRTTKHPFAITLVETTSGSQSIIRKKPPSTNLERNYNITDHNNSEKYDALRGKIFTFLAIEQSELILQTQNWDKKYSKKLRKFSYLLVSLLYGRID